MSIPLSPLGMPPKGIRAGANGRIALRKSTGRFSKVRSRGYMAFFHRVDQGSARPGQPTETERRLPLGQSLVVIAGLSALSWAALITIVIGLRAFV
jgi:hypothetical protein